MATYRIHFEPTGGVQALFLFGSPGKVDEEPVVRRKAPWHQRRYKMRDLSDRVSWVQRYKRRRRKRDGSLACEVCGWSVGNDGLINAHHIVPVCCGGRNEDRNMVLLCPNHHAIAHMLWPRVGSTYAGPRRRSEIIEALRAFDANREAWMARRLEKAIKAIPIRLPAAA